MALPPTLEEFIFKLAPKLKLEFFEWLWKNYRGWLVYSDMDEAQRRIWGVPHFQGIVESLGEDKWS